MTKVQINSQGKVYVANGKALLSNGSVTPSGTTDVPLTRISDDNSNEIGTWYMNFADANGNVFKVVLLDAQYRLASASWCSNTSTVTNMPVYSNIKMSNVWEAKETATQNTQLILDYCTAGGYTSSSCSHCRSQSFVINGTTYYGQLINMVELIHFAQHYNEFDALDASASEYPSTNFSVPNAIFSSSQRDSSRAWELAVGFVDYTSKTNSLMICPVLEIPL